MTPQISVYRVFHNIEKPLFKLMSKVHDLKQNAIIYSEEEEIIQSVDNSLWTIGKDSFLPHEMAASEFAEYNNIILTSDISVAKEFNGILVIFRPDLLDNIIENKNRIIILIDDTLTKENLLDKLKKYNNIKYWIEDKNGKWTEEEIQ